MREAQKSRHIPTKNAKNENIIRCILLSIEERKLLTAGMCKCSISEELFYKMLKGTMDKKITKLINENKKLEKNTDLMIDNYDEYRKCTEGNFKKAIKYISNNLLPHILVEVYKSVKK